METLEVVCSSIRGVHNPLLGIGATVSIREMAHRNDKQKIECQPPQASDQRDATDDFKHDMNPTE